MRSSTVSYTHLDVYKRQTLTLGADIGLVMAKGLFLGVACTITVLPALLMTFRKSIARHTHRTFIPVSYTHLFSK